ncbi:MAG: hypothetical protein ACFFAY_13645 [Promethearchaeota archaeon]
MQLFVDAIILAVFFGVIFLCAAISYGKGRASGTTKITRPSDKSVDGFGGVRARDYSHDMGTRWGLGGSIPVSLRLEREKTDTHKMSKGDEEEKL